MGTVACKIHPPPPPLLFPPPIPLQAGGLDEAAAKPALLHAHTSETTETRPIKRRHCSHAPIPTFGGEAVSIVIL